jgi:peptidoglycan LD-endopeptidase LytH
MRKFGVVFILGFLAFSGIAPATDTAWIAFGERLSRVVEVVALPFRLARLAVRPPDVRLLMPVAGAKVKHIADTWGAPRPGGRTHRGQDIFAGKGTSVFSATAGFVVRVGRNPLGGKAVAVAGAGGRRYYYAHLDAFGPEMRIGRRVTPDTVIGFVGNTGNAVQTPPHLHFAVYSTAGAVNPLPLLQDRTHSPR